MNLLLKFQKLLSEKGKQKDREYYKFSATERVDLQKILGQTIWYNR